LYMTLSKYIDSLQALQDEGKDQKIRDLLEYYDRYTLRTPPENASYGVIYARYSSHNQRDESIEGQVRDSLEYASRSNIIVLGIYMDRAQTGTSDQRPGFQQMIRDAEKRRWHFIIVWKVDRFARNRYDSVTYKSRLKKYGVRVVYAQESINDTPEGKFLEAILEGQAEYFSEQHKVNVLRGMTDNALEAKYNGGPIPYGFQVLPDRHFDLDPVTQPRLHFFYECIDSGWTFKMLEDYCNERGWKTSKGVAFNRSSFNRMLRNKMNIGIREWRGIVGNIPMAVEKDLFERVQIRLDNMKKGKRSGRNDEEYLLNSKIFCGLCGGAMNGETGTSRSGAKYHYYKCITRKRKHSCKKRPVPKDWIENLVIQESIRLLMSEGILGEIADSIVAYQLRDKDTAELDGLKLQLNEVVKGIDNLVKAIEQGIITSSTKERLEALEEEKGHLQFAIMEQSQKDPLVTREQIIHFLEIFRCGDARDPSYRKRIIDAMVNAVYVYEDRIVITYNYTKGRNGKAELKKVEKAVEAAEEMEAKCSARLSYAPPRRIKRH